jgi:sulfate transport system ATP-binding protein
MSIEARHITKTFGSFRALDDVSLTVPTGRLMALLGPSGSGKTTLLRIIAGLEQADTGSGQVLFDDADVAVRPVRRRGVGFVFQHYALFRHLTVFDNVAFGLQVRPRGERPDKAEIRRRVGDLLRMVQLDTLSDRYPGQLSGGQRQRVALARALAVEPQVLLLDEPFGALDAKVRKELRVWLRRLHDELHVTSVFVTHDQDEALEVADRVVVMNEGRIEQEGTPDEVFHRPATEFVMRFLGEVNQFHGRVDAGRVAFADVELDAGDHGRLAGPARVFVRPHEWEVSLAAPSQAAIRAVVKRVQSAGPVARLELRTADGALLNAELPQETLEQLGLAVGSEVHVTPRRLRVFAADRVPPPAGS